MNGAALEAGANPALVLSNVSAGYGETIVIDDVSMEIARGSCVSILGRNGVGKTSLLATIMGHTRLHGGQLDFLGREISAAKPHVRARDGLGYVPQEREVFPSLTVEENLAVAARGDPGWNKERVFELFPRLAERRRSRAGQLSGGEQQMLAIGRALMGNPSVVLMDEPSEGLAPVIVEQLHETIARLTRDESLTLLLVEQRVELALALSERAIVLERGRVVFDAPSETLANDKARMEALIGLAR